MIDYKKKYLKYKKKYLQTKNIYGGMESEYEWNCEGYFEDFGPDLKYYNKSKINWEKELPNPYPNWEEEKEWKLSRVTNLDDNERIGSEAYVFGYYNIPSEDIVLNPNAPSPYAEIIFTTSKANLDGHSCPDNANSKQRAYLKYFLSEKHIFDKKYSIDVIENTIINMHMLNAELGSYNLFSVSDSNSQDNLVLGSAQANIDHKYYEKFMNRIAYFFHMWNNTNTDAEFKLAMQTSIYFPKEFNITKIGTPYSYKGFILRFRLVEIDKNTGIVTPRDPREIIKLFDKTLKKKYCDDMGCISGPIGVIEQNYSLFNKYGSYIMINWDEDKLKENMLKEIHRILKKDYDCYKKLKIKNKNEKQLLSKIDKLLKIYHPDKFHYNEEEEEKLLTKIKELQNIDYWKVSDEINNTRELAIKIAQILINCKYKIGSPVLNPVVSDEREENKRSPKKQRRINICWHCEEPIEVGDMIRCGPTNNFKYEKFHYHIDACKLKYHKKCYDEIQGYTNPEGHFCKLICLKNYAKFFECCKNGRPMWDQPLQDLGISYDKASETYKMLQGQILKNEPKLYERVKKEFEEFPGKLFTGTIIEKYNDCEDCPLWHIKYEDGDEEDMDLREVESAHKLHNSIQLIVEKTSTTEELAYIAYQKYNGNINKAVNAINDGIIN